MKSILLVEDDKALAAHWQGLLESAQHRVVQEATVENAIQALDEEQFDLVITDIILGGSTDDLDRFGGLSVISYIALNVQPLPKIIATTGQPSTSTFVDYRFRRMGGIKVLRKPIADGELLSLTEQLLSEAPTAKISSQDDYQKTQAQLESALRSNEAMLDLLGQTDGVWDWRVGTDELILTPAFRKLLGFAGDDTDALPNHLDSLSARIHPDDLDTVWAAINISLQERCPLVRQYRLRKKSGDYVWVRTRATASFASSGEAIRMVGSTLDISAQQRAEELQRDASEKIQGIFNGTKSFLCLLSVDGQILEINRAALEVVASSKESVIGRKLALLPIWKKSSLNAEDLTARIDNAAGGRTEQFDLELEDATQGKRLYDFSIFPTLLEQGELKYLVFQGLDVTSERKAAHALVIAEERIRDVADINTPCWITKADSSCLWLNRRWLEYTGVSLEKQLGYGWADVVHPEDRQSTMEIYLSAVARQVDFELEYRLRRRDGVFRIHRSVGRVRRDSNGNFDGFVGYSVDIHDERATQRKLEQLNAELTESNEALEQFAYVASHDLRSPLRAVTNLVHFLQEDEAGNLADKSLRYMEEMKTRVQQMETLLDDLLMYSRVGKEWVKLESFSSQALVEEVVGILDVPEGIRIQIGPKLPSLTSYKSPLRQVFLNLIGNALKYHDKPVGRVQISAQQNGTFWDFEVRDDGPGIEPRFQDKIFEMFQRLDSKSHARGSGIGLALVRKIVSSHGGRIQVNSAVGEGSAFTFSWPETIAEQTQ